ncbi:MAG: pyrroline-5-carboxylate reductase [Steroidobacteraceae bacterium]
MQGLDSVSIAFLGGGNMARALLGGLLKRGLQPANVVVGEPIESARTSLQRDFGVRCTADNASAVEHAQVIVLAVKPQAARAVLGALVPRFVARRPPLLLSVAAGLRAADLARWCDGRVVVVRSMPNRPALMGAGATGLYAGAGVGEPQRKLAQSLMSATGAVVWVESEALLDIVTALSGSGPAYFFLLAEHMAEAAVRAGLAPDAARLLAAQTLYGAGLMAVAPDADLGRLRSEVTSKGGTTHAAIEVFRAGEFAALIDGAMAAAAQRSRELAQQLGED